MIGAGTQHSRVGIASFVLSFFPGVLLVGAYWLALLLISRQPPGGADEVGYAFGLLMLVLLTTLSEIVALGLGIAGTLQRHRKRTFALVGVACSVLVLAVIHSEVGLERLAFGILEGIINPPEVHHIGSPPGSE